MITIDFINKKILIQEEIGLDALAKFIFSLKDETFQVVICNSEGLFINPQEL